jgi:hypothetical protein
MASRPILDDVDLSAMSMPQGTRLSDPFKERKKARRGGRIRLLPTEWVSHFVRVKDGDVGVVKPMDFTERRYLKRVYDTPSRKILLFTSRQTEKSTTVGNKLLSFSGMRPLYVSLFVTPSAMQTKVFSQARLDDIIEISPLVQALTHKQLTMNILEKEFINRSKIYLRYAFLSADRIRGISANAIFGDEIQDLLTDVMPVIEETASHHKDPVFVYSGTPKTFDNTIEQYWSKSSTQSEWVIPCEAHGLPKQPGTWHWNILGVKHLGKKGPICDQCGKPIDPEHPMAQWAQMNPGAEFEGFRICRLMVPWYLKDPNRWREILQTYERYPTAQFMNEVMALSYDSGTKPLSHAEVRRVCDDAYDMDEDSVAKLAQTYRLYGGIDWGTGENAYTVMFVGGYVRGDPHFQIVYAKRFEGAMVDPEPQLAEIERLARKFRLRFIGVDYGMGFHPNKKLSSVFGPARIHQFQYAARLPAKVIYKGALHRYMTYRTPVMADVFNAIKATKIRFPSWNVFKEPFASDMLSIHSEYSDTIKMIKYDKPRSVTDDSMHALIYCFLASCFDTRRPDIIAPIRETGPGAEQSAREDYAMEEMEFNAAQDYASPID